MSRRTQQFDVVIEPDEGEMYVASVPQLAGYYTGAASLAEIQGVTIANEHVRP